MNLVAIIGNAAADPELRYTPAGKAICTFRVAVNRAGGDKADFFDVVCWERQAEIANEYIALGRRLGVEGRLQYSTWEKDGKRHSKVEIVAHRLQLLGGKPDLSGGGAGPLSEERGLLDVEQEAAIV